MNENRKHIDLVFDKLSERDLLEALAEQAAALSQAALRRIRAGAFDGCANAVPETGEDALQVLINSALETCAILYLFDLLPARHEVTGCDMWPAWAQTLEKATE